LNEALTRIAEEFQEFQDALKRNGFVRMSFNAERLKKTASGEFDPKGATESMQEIFRSLRKDFMPEDPGDRLALEPANFNIVIDSLEELNGKFISLNKELREKKPREHAANFEMLSTEISKVISTLERKKEGLQESRSLLQKYRER